MNFYETFPSFIRYKYYGSQISLWNKKKKFEVALPFDGCFT